MTFHERKDSRHEQHQRFEYGWRQRRCEARNGSGRYDNTGSPRCDACNGTGKERYQGPKAIQERIEK